MIRFTIAILLAVTLAGCTSESRDEAVNDNAPVSEVRIGQEFDDLPKVLLLNPADAAAFESNLAKHNETIRAWMEGEKGQRLVALETEIRIKTEEKDLTGLRAVIAQAAPLRNEITRLIESSHEELLDSLGNERRMQWEGHEVATALLELMAPLTLDAAQQSQIRRAAQRLLLAAHASNEPNPGAASFLELEKNAEQDVLTPKQRETYQAIKKVHPMRSLAL
ncbi:MAG: hypothetical protein VCD00_09795 [Candidatus Hydrogenedentota bacterium]